MENILISLIMGVALSAVCGFRVFIPMLVLSLGARCEYLTLGENWMWLASDPALIVFSTATVLEICAYYIPMLDHFLDMIAAPAAATAGTIVAAALFVDISPLMKWTLAIVAGGGAASVAHIGKTLLRAAVSVPSLGTGNWAVSTGEVLAAAGVGLLTLL